VQGGATGTSQMRDWLFVLHYN